MIDLRTVNYVYGSGSTRRQVLFDVTMAVVPGELVLLNGPSGSGKSTLLSLVGALRSAQDGSVRVLGHELRGAARDLLMRLRRRIGFVFQEHRLLDCLTALQNVQAPLLLDPTCTRQAAQRRAAAMLEHVGLGAYLDRHVDELSGGQRQRVAIARAMVTQPQLLLADEPTASLDRHAGADVIRRLRALVKQEGCAALVVTHDHRIAESADRVLRLEDGRLMAGGEGRGDATPLRRTTRTYELRPLVWPAATSAPGSRPRRAPGPRLCLPAGSGRHP